MSEWLKEHAWKAKRASDAEPLCSAFARARAMAGEAGKAKAAYEDLLRLWTPTPGSRSTFIIDA